MNPCLAEFEKLVTVWNRLRACFISAFLPIITKCALRSILYRRRHCGINSTFHILRSFYTFWILRPYKTYTMQRGYYPTKSPEHCMTAACRNLLAASPSQCCRLFSHIFVAQNRKNCTTMYTFAKVFSAHILYSCKFKCAVCLIVACVCCMS